MWDHQKKYLNEISEKFKYHNFYLKNLKFKSVDSISIMKMRTNWNYRDGWWYSIISINGKILEIISGELHNLSNVHNIGTTNDHFISFASMTFLKLIDISAHLSSNNTYSLPKKKIKNVTMSNLTKLGEKLIEIYHTHIQHIPFPMKN